MSSVNEQIATINQNVSQFNNSVSNIESYAKDAKNKVETVSTSVNKINSSLLLNWNIDLLSKVNLNRVETGVSSVFPFNYYMIGQNLQYLLESLTGPIRDQWIGAAVAGYSYFVRADWIANVLKPSLATLPNPPPSGWTVRLTISRTNGACVYDSVEDAKGNRVSKLTDNSKLTGAVPASLEADKLSYDGLSINLSQIIDYPSSVHLVPTAYKNSIWTDNLNRYEEYMNVYTKGVGNSWRRDISTGKQNYFVAAILNQVSPAYPNYDSHWVIRLSFQAV